MPTNSAFDAYFKDAASRIAQNKTITTKANPWAGYKASPVKTTTPLDDAGAIAGNLGQGVLDFLSTGTYAVAGVGQRVGESFAKLGQGDFGNVLPDLLGMGFVGGIQSGITNKRTWSDNLKAMGADEATSTWTGLALDVVLDPAWLIPGGAIAKGITGTARGIGVASKLNQAGIKLTPEVAKGVQSATEGFTRPGFRNLTPDAQGLGVLSDILKPSGTKISAASPQGLQNFYEGIKQTNIENYSEWLTARKAKKLDYYTVGIFSRKRPEYRASLKEAQATNEGIPVDSPLFRPQLPIEEAPAKAAAEAIANIVEDRPIVNSISDELKDANAAEDLASAAIEKVKPARTKKEKIVEAVIKAPPANESVYARSNREIGPARTAYQKENGFDTTDINYAAIKASENADDIGRTYDNLISDPTNPTVISAYNKLDEEARKQYDYIVNKLGIKIEFVQEDPYNILKFDANGKPVWKKDKTGKFVLDENGKKIQESVPSSKLMMEDLLDNKTFKVRDSAIDFVDYPHPIWNVEQNNIFRAVHEFFGHAASGRGFLADGEEAAWVSHSSMFSPEARRAMTTETRGQNSYYNLFEEFAPQKAALFPEEYTLLPAELDIVTGQALTSNAFFGRATNALSEVSDIVLDDLGKVQTPIRGSVLYTTEQLEKIKTAVEKIVQPSIYPKETVEHQEVVATLKEIISKLNGPFPELVASVKKPSDITTLKLLQETLGTPINVTELVRDLAKAEGKTMATPPAFKATYWGAAKGKPTFTIETLTKYFDQDELLNDPKKLGIAMGITPIAKAKVFARKGETAAQAYTRYQSTIWEDFRARNINRLSKVERQEKTDWNTKYNEPDSEMFTETSAGDLVGLGNLPEKFPAAMLTGSMNGKAISTLGKMLENVDSTIKASTLDPNVKKVMLAAFTQTLKNVNSKGIQIVDLTAKEVTAKATELLNLGVVKSFSDAKIAITGNADQLTKLASKPLMKLYVKDRSLLRKTSTLGKGQKVPLLRRDPTSGATIDQNGKIVTEREAAKLEVANGGIRDNGAEAGLRYSPIDQMRMVTDTGAEFTGRSGKAGSQYAEQTGLGKQQLAGLQAVRESIGLINTGIKAKEFLAIPEQATLLSNVMTTLGIKVADNLTPEAVFKLFQQKALPTFNEMVKKIESAAKSEAVIYQARAVFSKSIDENISLMKAIDASDPTDIQRSVVKFTEDSIALVDEYCATRFDVIGGPKTSATEFLDQITQGAISKGATERGALREMISVDRLPEDITKAMQKGRY